MSGALPQRFIAHGLVEVDGRVLLLRRLPGKYMGGRWDIPGGTVEPGEATDAACVRVVREESGLDVVIERELARQVNLDTEGRPIEFVTVTYLVCPTSPVTAITLAADEHDAFAWVDPAEVLRRTDVVWHVAPAIAAWREAVR